MIIMGVDPGYATVGFSIVNKTGGRITPIEHGVIITKPSLTFPERLEIIHDRTEEIIARRRPSVMSIEKLYHATNNKTVIDVAQARGVILLCAKKAGLEIYEYTPLQVKLAVTGYGQATKQQVQEMTKRLIGLPAIPKPDDAADALALAVCHAQSPNSRLRAIIAGKKSSS